MEHSDSGSLAQLVSVTSISFVAVSIMGMIVNTLEALQQPTGAEGFVTDGHCNCAQCTVSNTTVVADAATGDLFCPKDTRYCFEKDRDPATYSEERRALCRAPRSVR